MKYQVGFSTAATAVYNSLPRHVQNIIDDMKSWLSEDPYGHGSTGNNVSRALAYSVVLINYQINIPQENVYIVDITSIHFETRS